MNDLIHCGKNAQQPCLPLSCHPSTKTLHNLPKLCGLLCYQRLIGSTMKSKVDFSMRLRHPGILKVPTFWVFTLSISLKVDNFLTSAFYIKMSEKMEKKVPTFWGLSMSFYSFLECPVHHLYFMVTGPHSCNLRFFFMILFNPNEVNKCLSYNCIFMSNGYISSV